MRAFETVGVPFAASLMNLVVVTAALSSANTNLYLSTRMLFSLSGDGYIPAWAGRLSQNGVPHRALGLSTVGMVCAILLAVLAPRNAFLILYGTAVAGMFFVWTVILLTHLSFRKEIGEQKASQLPLRLPLHPIPAVTGIIALLAIAISTFWVPGMEHTIPTFALLLFLITLAYWKSRPKRKS